jgi:hypothetical protein
MLSTPISVLGHVVLWCLLGFYVLVLLPAAQTTQFYLNAGPHSAGFISGSEICQLKFEYDYSESTAYMTFKAELNQTYGYFTDGNIMRVTC